jgi:hypothetical protein
VTGTINSGSTGQMAYYTTNGTAIGGMNAVPLASGGTGATSASGALANLGAISAAATTPQTFASALTGPSLNASVNSRINVMAPPYNAKGDCSTDDRAALASALNAANATNPPAVVYFPLPPGGCYLTSTLPWYGISLEGQQPAGVNPVQGSAGVILKGQPGEDVFEAPDPTTVKSAAPRFSWSIRDIVFEVDDSVDASASFPHRWPGRWVQDAGMTASSAVITSPHALFTCGDVGQAIQVNGAGPSGANLVTTISSVFPCSNATGAAGTVTLASAASTTVTNASAYISVAGMAVTQTVGNAALAFDCYDGNSAHYTMAGTPQNVEDEMTNVKFYALSNASLNHSAGIFMQGCYAPYDLTVNHGDLYADFGAAFVPAELDTYQSQGLQDYLIWKGGNWEGNYPWISYDGGDGIIEGVQVFDGGYGPQILQSGVFDGDVPTGWTINLPETEGPNSANYGWRIEGSEYHLTNTYLGGAVGGTVGPIWDAVDSTCANCGWLGTPQINGSRNHIDFTGSLQTQQPIDNGIGNQIILRGFNPSGGGSASRSSTLGKTIFDQPVGARTADFIRDGNVATPYPSNNDLLFGPVDFKTTLGDDSAQISADPTAYFGKAYAVGASNQFILSFYSMIAQNYSGGLAIIGGGAGEVPATGAIVYFGFKCGSPESIALTVYATNTILKSDTPTCPTGGWATDGIAVDFTSYSGSSFGVSVQAPGNDAQLEFVGIRPNQHDYNGQQPVLSATPISTTGGGAAVPTGPATSVSGDMVTYTGTSGQEQDSGVLLSSLTAKAGTGSCPTSQYETGDSSGGPTCAQVAYSQISGTPSGLRRACSERRGGHGGGDLGNGTTANTATTASYPNPSVTTTAATAHNESAPRTCTTTNSGNAYSCSTSPTFTPAAGDSISIDFNAVNTGSATLAVNGAAAATIKKWGNSSSLASNDVLAGHWISATYDGTYWQLEGQLGNANATEINGGAVPVSANVLGTNSSGQPVSAATTGSGSVVLATSPTLSCAHGERNIGGGVGDAERNAERGRSDDDAGQRDAPKRRELESDSGDSAGIERRPDRSIAVQQLFGYRGVASAQGREQLSASDRCSEFAGPGDSSG